MLQAREDLNTLLLEVRLAGVGLLLLSVVLAVVAGLVRGDRSDQYEDVCVEEDEALLLSEMPPRRAALWDRGIDPDAALDECAIDPVGPLYTPVSAGLWLELVLCVALDIVGDASYFYPTFGEASDLGFAFAYSFAIELLFSWPTLAILAFWEEALPVTDLVPSATLAWLLVITGVRDMLQRPSESVQEQEDERDDTDMFGGPLADRRAFMPPEPYLQEGNGLFVLEDEDQYSVNG